MQTKTNDELVALINGSNGKTKIKDAIRKAIYHHFGVNVSLVAKDYKGYVEVSDTGNDVEAKMRGNKMLRSVFSSVHLWGNAWQEEETGNIYIRLHVSYTHPSKGSNGIEIGNLLVHKNGKCTLLKY